MFQDLLDAYAECTSLYEQFSAYKQQTETQMEHFAERMCRMKLRLEFLVLDMPEARMPLLATDGPHLRLSSPPVRLSSRPPTEAAISTPPSPTAAAVDAAPVPPAPAVEERFYNDDNIAEWIAATDFSRLGNDMAVTSSDPPLIVLSSSDATHEPASDADRPWHGTTAAIRERRRKRHHRRPKPYTTLN